MGKIDKKKKKLQERIDWYQNELTQHLTKKDSRRQEIDVAGYQRKILELRKELAELR
jgi:hypothetical protein